MEVKGKVALVTGAASGIGLAIVKELLRNDVKAVAMLDVNAVGGRKVLGEIQKEFEASKVIFLHVDVSNQKQLEEAFETTVKTFENLDIVVNNAGIADEVQWEKCVSVNLIGTIAGTLLAVEKYLPRYKSSKEAVVVNTSSICGLFPEDSIPIYTTTKYGVLGLTRSMGSEFRYKKTNIKVIGICPARTNTELGLFNMDQLPEPFHSRFLKVLAPQTNQSPDVIAKHTVRLMETAPSGSIWKMMENQCEQAEFEDIQF